MLILESDVKQVANEVMNMLHEDEVELINEFHDAVVAKDIEKIDELFVTLMTEMEAHFKTEEEMMAQSGYANAHAHQKDHDVMRKKLAKFHKRWEVLKGPKEVRTFLDGDFKKWWTTHISRWSVETAMQLGDS